MKFYILYWIFAILQCATLQDALTSTTEPSEFKCPSHCDYCSHQICHQYFTEWHYRDSLPGWYVNFK